MNVVKWDTYSRSNSTSGSIVAIRSRGSLYTRKENDDTLQMINPLI